MTWHAKALQTSYVSAPGPEARAPKNPTTAFPFTTTSWYFLDAVDVQAPDDTQVVACFGDSITDGTGSTLNGDDRWPDVLARRLRAAHGSRFAVVNAGIGGNRITGPTPYDPKTPFAGGPSALDRLDRDVLSLSGLSTIIWLEGINDLSSGASADAVIAGIREGVRRIRARGGIRVLMGTITPALGSTAAAGTADVDARRQAVNAFIRSSDLFDGVLDFDARDPRSAHRRPPRGVSTEQQHRRSRRRPAPEPRGISRDGECGGSEAADGAQIVAPRTPSPEPRLPAVAQSAKAGAPKLYFAPCARSS